MKSNLKKKRTLERLAFLFFALIPTMLFAADYGSGVAKYNTVKLPDNAAVYEKEYYPTSDDAIGIFSAIYKANFFGGGTVVLEEKTYVLDRNILLSSKVRLKGAGIGKTILKRGPEFDNTTNGYLLGSEQGGVSDAVIMDLTVDSAYTPEELNGKEENPLLGIFFNSEEAQNTRLLFDNIEVKGCSMGIHIKGSTHVTVQNSNIHDNGGIYLYHNIYYRRVGQALFYKNNIYNAVAGSGLKLAGGTNTVPNESRYFTIIKNNIYNNERINLNLQGVNDMLIEGNNLNSQNSTTSKMGGVYLVSYSGYTCDNSDIINNIVKDNTNNGFYVKGCSNINIEGNACYNNGNNYNLLSNSILSCDYNTKTEITGVKALNSSVKAINIYPNPASDMLYIKNASAQKLNYDIYSISGCKVISSTTESRDKTIDISSLDSGVYFVRMGIGEKYSTSKIIKK